MTLNDAERLLTHFQNHSIYPRQYKFKSNRQIAIILVERPGGAGYVEVHLHYAWNGNGILTGANIRWPEESGNAAIDFSTNHRLARTCDELIVMANEGHFDEDVWTCWNL